MKLPFFTLWVFTAPVWLYYKSLKAPYVTAVHLQVHVLSHSTSPRSYRYLSAFASAPLILSSLKSHTPQDHICVLQNIWILSPYGSWAPQFCTCRLWTLLILFRQGSQVSQGHACGLWVFMVLSLNSGVPGIYRLWAIYIVTLVDVSTTASGLCSLLILSPWRQQSWKKRKDLKKKVHLCFLQIDFLHKLWKRVNTFIFCLFHCAFIMITEHLFPQYINYHLKWPLLNGLTSALGCTVNNCLQEHPIHHGQLLQWQLNLLLSKLLWGPSWSAPQSLQVPSCSYGSRNWHSRTMQVTNFHELPRHWVHIYMVTH